MAVVVPDASIYQAQLDDSYPRGFVIIRGSFGAGLADGHFLANANEIARLYAAGRLKGAIVYTVYLPGLVRQQFAFLWRLIGPTPPPWLAAVMIDVESWRNTGYAISGDHSREINQLAGMHAARMGTWDGVIGYGNRSDLASIWPNRDRRVRVIVAGYSSVLTYRQVRGAIGQQYTDGSVRWPVPYVGGKPLPRATPPFGPCDHNVFPDFADGKALRSALRPAPGKHAAQGGGKPTKPPAGTGTGGGTVPVKSRPRPYYPAPSSQHVIAIGSPDRSHAAFVTDAGDLIVNRDGRTVTRIKAGA